MSDEARYWDWGGPVGSVRVATHVYEEARVTIDRWQRNWPPVDGPAGEDVLPKVAGALALLPGAGWHLISSHMVDCEREILTFRRPAWAARKGE